MSMPAEREAEVPDISFTDIGGLDDHIEQIADVVELPFPHQNLLAEHQLPAPKGILWYRPPGCGKSLIAKRRWLADDRVLRRDRLDVRTGGSKISSDMESTIDPAILRPGRLDVKIKIERPNAQAAEAIFARYLTNEIPIAEGIGSEL